LVWDCIKESYRLLSKLQKDTVGLEIRNYTKSAKKNYYKINVTKNKDKRVKLFTNQLALFTKSINQVDQVIRNPKKKVFSAEALVIKLLLEDLLPLMHQVYSMTKNREILGKKVTNKEKLFSIYELHTDIIVKGGREVLFGHKVNLSGGRSNLILDCETLNGNPSDSKLYQNTLDRITDNYGIVPRDVCTDGGYASNANKEYAQENGIVNIVFNKIVGSLQNIASSKKMETMLKKWRSGIEAVISNYKRGFGMSVCNWKGEKHFKAKVLWSAIAYNIRVMTRLVIEQMKPA
jgi:IS5 family transposase